MTNLYIGDSDVKTVARNNTEEWEHFSKTSGCYDIEFAGPIL
jgi:hypothetical protein